MRRCHFHEGEKSQIQYCGATAVGVLGEEQREKNARGDFRRANFEFLQQFEILSALLSLPYTALAFRFNSPLFVSTA